jgi:hypothetical protein
VSDRPLETVAPTAVAGAEDRFARLAAATARLRGRSGPVAERWLFAAGAVLVPLGAVVVLLGWYGTAHTTRLWQQMPYVVSGGLLGLGLMVVGGLGYFAAWLTRLVEDNRRQARELTAALERVEAHLAAVVANLANRPTGPVDTAGTAPVSGAQGSRNGRSAAARRAGRSGGRATV